MIYITGDTHGIYDRFDENKMGDSDWNENDVLIICGDFGFIWWGDDYPDKKQEDNKVLDLLSKKPYQILWIDGNHENFNELYKYPLVDKFGGKAHKIRENIYHLERGYVFEIQGKTFFTFGGAYSVDRGSRIKGYSWWHQEKPSKEEYQRGKTALESVKRVDYIITHTAPFCAVDKLKYLIPYSERKDFYIDLHDYDLLSYFEELTTLFEFGHWYFGHWHKDKKIDERFTAVYEKVYAIKGEKE